MWTVKASSLTIPIHTNSPSPPIPRTRTHAHALSHSHISYTHSLRQTGTRTDNTRAHTCTQHTNAHNPPFPCLLSTHSHMHPSLAENEDRMGDDTDESCWDITQRIVAGGHAAWNVSGTQCNSNFCAGGSFTNSGHHLPYQECFRYRGNGNVCYR